MALDESLNEWKKQSLDFRRDEQIVSERERRKANGIKKFIIELRWIVRNVEEKIAKWSHTEYTDYIESDHWSWNVKS